MAFCYHWEHQADQRDKTAGKSYRVCYAVCWLIVVIATGHWGPSIEFTAKSALKAVLHQRANRIGKLEGKIQKITKALEEVETTWPNM